MKDMIKDALVLFVITLIAGLALGYVYHITKDPIAASELKAKNESYAKVFPEASSFEAISFDETVFDSADWKAEGNSGIVVTEVASAKDSSDSSLGYVLLMKTKNGYGGDITFSMGITNEGVVNGISILTISETAGLGMRAEEVLQPQFQNKAVEKFSLVKNGATSDSQIDAISGATITSNAVTNAVNAGLYYFENSLGGGN